MELITISQAAKLLGVHIDTLRNWDKQGIFKPIRINKDGWRRYKKEDILKILEDKNGQQEKQQA